MQKQIDLLAVGDITIDAFIKLKDASVHCKINNEDCEICMRWGDKIPYELNEVVPAVGNSANAAVAAARLGLSSSLRAYVGKDTYGQQCIDALKAEGVATNLVEQSANEKTNYHYVLWFESQRTILVKHEERQYQVPAVTMPPQWLYLSSLGENSLPYHHALMEQLKGWPGTKLAFQPGTFQIKFGVDVLRPVYEHTDIFFCNKEEAELILSLEQGHEIKDLLKKVQGLGPKIVVITDDIRGAYAINEVGTCLYVPRYPDPRAPFEITGAGDAFASGVVAALALGKPLEEALLWGSINASAVVQQIGAQKGLLTRSQLEEKLTKPPGPFVLEELK